MNTGQISHPKGPGVSALLASDSSWTAFAKMRSSVTTTTERRTYTARQVFGESGGERLQRRVGRGQGDLGWDKSWPQENGAGEKGGYGARRLRTLTKSTLWFQR